MMEIRKTRPADLETLSALYENARRFMRENGNPGQWKDGYPSREKIEQDIGSGRSYVCEEDGEILGAFYFSQEEEPTYREIYDGAWLNGRAYGVVHRIAVKTGRKGVASFCLKWCYKQCGNIRIDTHRDNLPMKSLLEKCGYRRCGIIYLENGDERIAFQKTNRKKRLLCLGVPLCAVLLILAAGVRYVNDYYHSDEEAAACLAGGGTVKVVEYGEGLLFDGAGEETALIFYPGAKVEETAYAPLLHRLAERGIDCFLVRMPFRLAVLGKDKADGLLAAYDYENWYIGGHSLGGAMAASYASGHPGRLDGLILLAAYPTEKLPSGTAYGESTSDGGFTVLTVYGSEDGVLNRAKLEEGRQFMPEAYTELMIEGGNHAGFGSYGEQKGDGSASVSREEQQEQTVKAILRMIGK